MGKAVFYNGEIYVIGGETSTGSGATADKVYNRVDIYNVATNTWRLGAPMPTARHGIFPVLSGTSIFVAGGGIRFVATAVAMHLLYLLYSSAVFTIVSASTWLSRRRQKVLTSARSAG